MKRSIVLLLLLLGGATAAQAQVRYISDNLVVPLRAGQGLQYKIVRNLPAGTKLQILKEAPDTGYALVRAPDGAEGWALTQYMVDQPVARDRLPVVEARLAKFQEENGRVKQELAAARTERDALQKDLAQTRAENERLSKDLARLRELSAHPAKLDSENRTLKQQTITLEKDLQVLAQENNALKSRAEREWFVAGAGVLLGGMLLGLILPKLRRRKTSGW